MKRLPVLLALGAAAIALVWLGLRDADAPARAPFRTAVIDRGSITAQVSATGTIAPVSTVIVGSQLSGQVVEIFVDYNSPVKTGQILARLNADQIRARLDAARAELAQAQAARTMLDAQLEKSKADEARADATAADMRAQLARAETQLADAEKTLARQLDLSAQGIVSASVLQTARTQRDTLIAQKQSALAQIESVRAQKMGLTADRKVLNAQMISADAQIQQRSALVRQIEVDLTNSDIRSPVDGVVVQRNVELGQPVAASLQAPTLFLVAEDLRRIQIQANVDEADVGRVQEGQTVSFTVNTFPGRTFSGVVRMVRLGSQTVQNVVIYTTIIDVENPNLELRPGMTANLRILTDQRQNALRLPNAALRWRPPVSEDGATGAGSAATSEPTAGAGAPPVRGEAGRGGRGRFVERLKSELALTDEQKAALDQLLAEMPSSGSTDGSGGAARGAFNQKLVAILTEEQRIKFAAMQDRRRSDRDGAGQQPRPAAQAREGTAGRAFRLDQNDQPVATPLRLGNNDGSYTEILSGLSAGDKVIIGGGTPLPRQRFRFGF